MELPGSDLRRSHPVAWVSLGVGRWWTAHLTILGAVAGWALHQALGLTSTGPTGALLTAATVVPSCLALAILPTLIVRRLRLVWLAKLDLPLDRASYLAALDGRSPRGALEVEVELVGAATPRPEALPLPTALVQAAAGELRVLSPARRTWRMSYLMPNYFHNGHLHTWLVTCVERVLRPLHRHSPIKTIRVRYLADPEAELARRRAEGGALEVDDPPRLAPAQRRRTISWLVGSMTPIIAGAVSAGFTDHARFLPAVLAGVLFAVTAALGALTFVLGQLRVGSRAGAALRRPMEWIGEGVLLTFLGFFIVFLAERVIWAAWWPSGGGERFDGFWGIWFIPSFFSVRLVLYVVLWGSLAMVASRASEEQDRQATVRQLDKLGRRAGPISIFLLVTLSIALFDWVVSLRPGALAPWLAPLLAAHLAAGGFAAALGLATLITLGLGRAGLLRRVPAEPHRRFAAAWLLRAAAAWLVLGAALAVVVAVGPDAVRASWQPGWLEARWRGWTIVDLAAHALPLLILAAPAARRSGSAVTAAAILLVAGHAVHLYQLVMPGWIPDGKPSWIELAGFAAGACGLLIGLLRSLGERALYPLRDPLLAPP